MGENFWKDKTARRLSKRQGDARRKLLEIEDRKARGVNLVSGVPDNELIFVAEARVALTRLDARRYRAIVEQNAPDLEAALSGFEQLREQLAAYPTQSAVIQEEIDQMLRRIRVATILSDAA